jgi:hypothetical protein
MGFEGEEEIRKLQVLDLDSDGVRRFLEAYRSVDAGLVFQRLERMNMRTTPSGLLRQTGGS